MNENYLRFDEASYDKQLRKYMNSMFKISLELNGYFDGHIANPISELHRPVNLREDTFYHPKVIDYLSIENVPIRINNRLTIKNQYFEDLEKNKDSPPRLINYIVDKNSYLGQQTELNGKYYVYADKFTRDETNTKPNIEDCIQIDNKIRRHNPPEKYSPEKYSPEKQNTISENITTSSQQLKQDINNPEENPDTTSRIKQNKYVPPHKRYTRREYNNNRRRY